MNRRTIIVAYVMIMSALASCAAIVMIVWPASPTIAVIREAFLSPVGSGLPSEFQLLQRTPIGSGMAIYYTYHQTDLKGTPGECRFVSYAKLVGFGWKILESYGGCLPLGNETSAFAAESRSWNIPGETPWSEIHGKATYAHVDWVRVSWSDGTVDTAKAVEGYFLVARFSDVDVMQIEAIDLTGETIATLHQISNP